MRRVLTCASALGSLVLAVACTDQPRQPPPTAPIASVPLLSQGSQCSGALASQISKEEKALFVDPALSIISAQFSTIKHLCAVPTSPAAFEAMMVYLQETIDAFHSHPPQIVGGATTQQGVDHWRSVTLYVDGTALSRPAGVLDNTGAAGVAPSPTPPAWPVEVITGDRRAGLLVRQLSSPIGSHLFTINLLSPSCLTTNLRQFAACYNFDVYRAASNFSPPLVVALCRPDESATELPVDSYAHLGHRKADGTTEVLADPADFGVSWRFLQEQSVDPAGCNDLSVGGNNFGLGNGAFARLLGTVARALTPRSLFAAHGGLGGMDEFSGGMSPIGSVNVQTFAANFNKDVVGLPPTSPDLGGGWSQTVQSPGSILVQSAIGDPVGGLNDKPVVLNQGGGACTNCGTLELTGALFDSSTVPANVGTYTVSWYSLQDKPTVKDAPLLLRDSNGLEIARLSYKTISSIPKLFYNDTTDTGCLWTQHVAQHFTITVDLNNKKTTLAIDGCSPNNVSNVNFRMKATDLYSIGWEEMGIDAGIIGWDNITIFRNADPVTIP
jgi:hypothetical protein